MRRTVAVLALVVGVMTSAQAQHTWRLEMGMQGGFTRAVAAGAGGSPTDAVGLPGFSLGPALPLATGLFLVIPWTDQLAVEADVSASQLTIGATGSLLTFGLRGDYALTSSFYAAAGGALSYTNGALGDESQLGVQVALGYRRRLTGPLNGRLEARTTFWRKAENFGPVNAYSLLLGVSTATGRGRAGTVPRDGKWTTRLGVAGGYANVHLIGGGSLTALAFPGYGGALGLVFAPEVTLPPTVFAIIPVWDRIALEPALDIHRFQEAGQTAFSGNMSARFNYAVSAGWYGALGANLHYVKSTGVPAFARTGLNLAWGCRFDLSGPLGGRVEVNYTMFGANHTFAINPTNTFGLMFGVTMPLK